MNRFRAGSILLLAATLAACTGGPRREIEGNNTGGVIPGSMIAGGNAASLAGAYCAKFGTNARITFEPSQAGGDVVFVCERPAAAAPPPGVTQRPTAGGKQAPK
jgi:hypothetical protein